MEEILSIVIEGVQAVTDEEMAALKGLYAFCQDADDFIAQLKGNEVELSEDQCARIREAWPMQALSDEELDNVGGGSMMINGKSYSDDPHGQLIVTCGNSCDHFYNGDSVDKKCRNCMHVSDGTPTMYCRARTRHGDPLNPAIGGNFRE